MESIFGGKWETGHALARTRRSGLIEMSMKIPIWATTGHASLRNAEVDFNIK
jgi:hypothetical protein